MSGEWNLFQSNFAAVQLPDRDLIRLILISSPESVKTEIQRLHLLHYREATTWSPLLPTPTPGQVMSINTHYRVRSR